MTLGCLAAGGSFADRPITAGANRTCSVGLLSSLALIIPMILSTWELTPLVPGPYVDSTCSEGQECRAGGLMVPLVVLPERSRCTHSTCSSWVVV